MLTNFFILLLLKIIFSIIVCDLIDKINYYSTHQEEAQAIIQHANEYTLQFKNKKREDLISYLVLKKYFGT